LGEKRLVHNKVRFPENSIRKFTNKVLNDWITNIEFDFYGKFSSWQDLITEHPEYDLQDVYHIYHVAIAVKNWFEALKVNEGSGYLEHFKHKLLNNVKLIVNEVSGSQSEEKIFGNLNSKRIPLDGADLVRAILITRVAKEEAKVESDLKNIIFVNERRIKLGWELDQINSWWSQKNVKIFFQRFISIPSEVMGKNKLFNEDIHSINYLYLLFAESRRQDKLTLSFIENNTDVQQLHKDIIHMHQTIQDWYQDRNIYHLLGYLFANDVDRKRLNFVSIWKLWTSSDNRNEFIDSLIKIIKREFEEEGQLIDFTDQNVNWYSDKDGVLVKTLLLMDVLECLKKNRSVLPAEYFKKQLEDIEHIFPQNPREKSNKEIIDYIQFLIKIGKIKPDEYNIELLEDADQRKLILDILDKITEDIRVNSIGNLVLLHRSINRGLGNKTYEQKRSRIISHHNKGEFIQPHTFKVFVRDFLETEANEYTDNEFWLQKDIEHNAKYINEQIKSFLTTTYEG
jgi:hypothetical protein